MLDDRLLRATIFLDGEPHPYERLAISAVGTKFTSAISNICQLNIGNIKKSVREKLLTEGTPYTIACKRLKNTVRIEAGRESFGFITIYEGDIATVAVGQPPDITLSMRAMTGGFRKTETVSVSLDTTSKFSTIAKQVGSTLGIPVDFKAPDKDVRNFSFSGSAEKLISALEDISLGVIAYVDDDRLTVREQYKTDLPVVDININTGLVGIPEFVDLGIRCKVLLRQEIRLGSLINLTSAAYPSVNGRYILYKLDFNLANRDNPFYYILEASREDLSDPC